MSDFKIKKNQADLRSNIDKRRRSTSIHNRVLGLRNLYTKCDFSDRGQVLEKDLLFKKEDIARAPKFMLRLLRLVMYKLRISELEYDNRVRSYSASLGRVGTQISSDVHNSKDAMRRDNLSADQFQKIMNYIGYNILDVGVTLQDVKTGELVNVNLSEIESLTELDLNSILGNKSYDTEDDLDE